MRNLDGYMPYMRLKTPEPHFPKLNDLIFWLVLALVTVMLSRNSNIDWQVADFFHGPMPGGFPLRNDSFWVGAHTMTRNISTIFWLLLLGMTIREARLHGRTEATKAGTFILLASAVALGVNGVLKTNSIHSCPWNLSGFGGTADFFRLLDPVPPNPGSGGCLPSGHAAVGFMWWPVVYACTLWRPALTTVACVMVLSFGIFCGYLQIVRGAHFVSHVLMTAAVTGGCTGFIFHICIRLRIWQPLPAQNLPQG